MVATIGSPKARALASAMRQAREHAGFTVRGVAEVLEISHSVVSYWENGKRLPRIEDVGSYLTAIGVTGEHREKILDLARNASEPSWLAAGIPGMSSGLAGVLECERTAIHIRDWTPNVVTGLLQTADYARAIIGSGVDGSAAAVDARVMLRSGRRDILTGSDPVQLHALIGELGLRVPIGGVQVQIEQLRYLLKVCDEQASVTVQVVPSVTSWHPGMAGPFVVYEFADSPPIVLLEHHRSSAFLYEEEDVAEYQRVATLLEQEKAMSPGDSLGLIADIIEQMEQE